MSLLNRQLQFWLSVTALVFGLAGSLAPISLAAGGGNDQERDHVARLWADAHEGLITGQTFEHRRDDIRNFDKLLKNGDGLTADAIMYWLGLGQPTHSQTGRPLIDPSSIKREGERYVPVPNRLRLVASPFSIPTLRSHRSKPRVKIWKGRQ